MNIIYEAIVRGLITSCNITISGVVICSSKKPHGVLYTIDNFKKKVIPALSSKLKQLEEAEANTLEPQA